MTNRQREPGDAAAAPLRSRPAALLEGTAFVSWRGDLENGRGSLRLGAGDELPLLWPGSSADTGGTTSPEELVAAAHAACFAMTLAHTLARSGHPPKEIAVEAKATFGLAADVRAIRRSQLDLAIEAEGLSERELTQATEAAGRYCPVSNSLRMAGVELDVRSHATAQP